MLKKMMVWDPHLKPKKKKKDKGEDMDYEDEFEDDNKEDRYRKNTDFEVGKLSADSKDLKKTHERKKYRKI